jgi:hypothetical protein
MRVDFGVGRKCVDPSRPDGDALWVWLPGRRWVPFPFLVQWRLVGTARRMVIGGDGVNESYKGPWVGVIVSDRFRGRGGVGGHMI